MKDCTYRVHLPASCAETKNNNSHRFTHFLLVNARSVMINKIPKRVYRTMSV